MTVFSASNYCGLQGNWGGLVVFHAPAEYTFKEHMAPCLVEVTEVLEPQVGALPRSASKVFQITMGLEEEEVELRCQAAICERLEGSALDGLLATLHCPAPLPDPPLYEGGFEIEYGRPSLVSCPADARGILPVRGRFAQSYVALDRQRITWTETGTGICCVIGLPSGGLLEIFGGWVGGWVTGSDPPPRPVGVAHF